MATINKRILKKCEKQGDCLIYTGRLVRGRPNIAVKRGDKWVNVDIQRQIAIQKFNLVGRSYVSVTTSCGNPLCLNKAHIEVQENKKKEQRKLNHTGRPVNRMAQNKKVFALSVTFGADTIVKETGYSLWFIQYVRRVNVAMLPYFQSELERHVGMTVSEMRKGNTDKIAQYFNLSPFAVSYLNSTQDYPIHDPDLYNQLLDNCIVFKDHLVWVGDKNDVGTPVVRVFGYRARKAIGAFMYATFGLDMLGRYENTCGFKDCVNPYHYKELKDETVTTA